MRLDRSSDALLEHRNASETPRSWLGCLERKGRQTRTLDATREVAASRGAGFEAFDSMRSGSLEGNRLAGSLNAALLLTSAFRRSDDVKIVLGWSTIVARAL